MEKDYTLGVIRGNISEIGRTIRWMVKEFLFGQTGENIKGIIKMTKRMVMGYSNGMYIF